MKQKERKPWLKTV